MGNGNLRVLEANSPECTKEILEFLEGLRKDAEEGIILDIGVVATRKGREIKTLYALSSTEGGGNLIGLIGGLQALVHKLIDKWNYGDG